MLNVMSQIGIFLTIITNAVRATENRTKPNKDPQKRDTRVRLETAATGTGNDDHSTSEKDGQSGNEDNTYPIQDHMTEDTSNKHQHDTNGD